uniref:ATP synthase complex subunit 8 n=1 Tax=Eolachesilla chilensis TaxID=297977 RepID=A0A8K1ZFE6_9NEOP|nr:ATP synthase F0 subunit 8 [Eolachesilla chilensis]
MPQMNPIWWLSLFIMFISVLLLVNSLNYFISPVSPNSSTSTSSSLNLKNWKW